MTTKRDYFAPSSHSIRVFDSEKRKFLRKYPDAKVTRKGGDVRVNGIYALYIGSAIGQGTGYEKIFKKLEDTYNRTIKK